MSILGNFVDSVNHELNLEYLAGDVDLRVNDRAFKKNGRNVTWFDGFQNAGDFRNDVKCLLIKPAIHWYLSYMHSYNAWLKFRVALVHLVTLSPSLAFLAFKDFAASFLKMFLYSITGYAQILMQACSLMVRTLVSVYVGGYNWIDALLHPENYQDQRQEVQPVPNPLPTTGLDEDLTQFMRDIIFNAEINSRAASDESIQLKVGYSSILRNPARGPGLFPEFKRRFQYVNGAVTFLDEFQSLKDFQNDVKCLFIKPMLCYIASYEYAAKAGFKLWLAFSQLVTGSPGLAWHAFKDCVLSVVKAYCYIAIFHAQIALQLLSFASRCIISAGAYALDGFKAAREYFAGEENQPEERAPMMANMAYA